MPVLITVRRGAGTPACRVETRLDPFVRSLGHCQGRAVPRLDKLKHVLPKTADRSVGAADTSVRATSHTHLDQLFGVLERFGRQLLPREHSTHLARTRGVIQLFHGSFRPPLRFFLLHHIMMVGK